MNIITSAFLSLLPKRYRVLFTSYDVPCEGAVVSGILQALLSFFVLFRDYHAFFDMRMAQLPTDLLVKVAEKGGDPAIAAFGPMFLIEYLFRVTTILFLFWTIEGVVRAIAAIGAKEILPDLLLCVVALLHAKVAAENHKRKLGSPLSDEVQFDPTRDRLQISSCRPKPWIQLTTISHEGQFYEMVSE
ncbi:MAG TPA: hypothetical protein VMG82_12675 [Candidatus Sulfotelmatobacter sp.]|nr:hypothetical protein [Candidatus Sulfotelmatobacter sp.]